MKLRYVPLLQVQRDLYAVPRGIGRSSEAPSAERAVREALAAVFRCVHVQRHGFATRLGEMLDQEGFALASAGETVPTLDGEEIAYTREVLEPHRKASDRPTVMAALYGDEAARKLGYRPLGLSDCAGLALVLHDARTAARR